MTSKPSVASDLTVAKEEKKPPTLYDAAVNFLVSEETKSNAWEQVATYVNNAVQGGWTSEQLTAAFEAVEKQVKIDFALKNMPSSWRSAKTVAKQAAVLGVALVDKDTGKVNGKTVVEKANKLTLKLTTSGGKPTPFNLKEALDLADSLFRNVKDLCDADQRALAKHILAIAPVTFLKQMEA